MDIFQITLISLWLNPVLGYILARVSKNKLKTRRLLSLAFTFVFILHFFSILLDITFTSIIADFIFSSIFYLGVCFFIWIIIFLKKKIFKVFGIILAVAIFSLNYFSATIGALGVGFILYNWETSQEIKFEDNIIYKEVPLGMALDEFRGKRIEIFKKINYLPIEKKIIEKSYYNEIPWSLKKLTVDYNLENKEIYLSGIDSLRNNESEYWSDTIIIF